MPFGIILILTSTKLHETSLPLNSTPKMSPRIATLQSADPIFILKAAIFLGFLQAQFAHTITDRFFLPMILPSACNYFVIAWVLEKRDTTWHKWFIKHFKDLRDFQHNVAATSETNGAVIGDIIKYCKRLELYSLLSYPEQKAADANGNQTRYRDIFVVFGNEQEREKPRKFDQNEELEICEDVRDDGETRFGAEVEYTPILGTVSQKYGSVNAGLKTGLREDDVSELLQREIRNEDAGGSDQELDRLLEQQLREDEREGEKREEKEEKKKEEERVMRVPKASDHEKDVLAGAGDCGDRVSELLTSERCNDSGFDRGGNHARPVIPSQSKEIVDRKIEDEGTQDKLKSKPGGSQRKKKKKGGKVNGNVSCAFGAVRTDHGID